MERKKCTKCGVTKDISYFQKRSRNKDGFSTQCKACKSKRYKKRKENNIKLRMEQKYKFVIEKVCNKCKKSKNSREFYKDNGSIDGYKTICKSCYEMYHKEKFKKLQNDANCKLVTEKTCYKCNKTKSPEEFHKNKYNYDGLQKMCKLCRSETYHVSDKTLKRKYDADRYQKNKESHNILCRKHYSDHKEEYKIYNKEYHKKNKEVCNVRNKQYSTSNARYEGFFNKLTIDESPILHNDGVSLEVKCKYCGKYFIPTNRMVTKRTGALNGIVEGDGYLYCSDSCKYSCPVFGQHKYPKGFKQKNGEITENSGHEGDEIWRQEIIKRNIEEYGQLQCEICGNTNENELSTHHEKPRKTHPEMSLDPDNGWVLCSFGKGNNCHLKYGHPKGTSCSTVELAKLVCGKKQKNVV